MIKVALFGLGYTGKFLLNTLQGETFDILAFSRFTQINHSPIANIETIEGVQQVESLILDSGISLACITIPPEKIHPTFWKMLESTVPFRLLLGTTSIYATSGQIKERSEVDFQHPRYLIEQTFMRNGGTVFRLSGIYGPGRNPFDWILRAKNIYAQKQLNLIHVNDIIQTIKAWMLDPETGGLYNLSDGQRHSWGEITAWARKKGLKMAEIPSKMDWKEEDERLISPEKVLKRYPELMFLDFFEAIEYQGFGD